MNKKILKSLLTLALVASSVYGVAQSGAWFTDQEQVLGNSIDTGTIDIAVDDSTTAPFVLSDLKPSQHGYHEFVINNVGSNPANIYKLLEFRDCVNEPVSEPEKEAEDTHGVTCRLQDVTNYDMEVWVYQTDLADVYWHQIIYSEEFTVTEVYDAGRVLLGMVPAGWHMKVEQSYHMPGTTVGNRYQGDSVVYDMTLDAEQLMGTVILEDKDTTTWAVNHDDVMGTLTYSVREKTFDFTFVGKAPLASTEYVLAAGYNTTTDVDTELGRGTTNASGNITITGDVDLNKDLKSAKVWLVPASDWSVNHVFDWSQMGNFLWETGLMDYYDADII